MGSGHRDHLQFLFIELFKANELEVSQVGTLVLDSISYADVTSVGSSLLSQSHDVQESRLSESVHGFLGGNFNEEFSGCVVHVALESSMGISLLPLSDKDD